ncbi:MAG: YjbQ family protein [Nitrospirae bacterium]|nr:YjbQ family protein [Nitrospirota bacterium]
MKTYKEFIRLTTRSKEEIVNITARVQHVCRDSHLQEGLVLVFPHHTSSAVYISDSDTCLTGDYQKVWSQLVPEGDDYAHNRSDPKKNAEGHLKSILTGHHIVLPLSNGQLDLGIYQTIYYAEFDGKREKEILVKIIGG